MLKIISISHPTKFTFSLFIPKPVQHFPIPKQYRLLTTMSRYSEPDDTINFGFSRTEMYETDLAGTVTRYDRHVFLRYKSYDTWPVKVESSVSDPLPKAFADGLKARKSDIKLKTRLTVCEGVEGSDGDVLIFPEMIKYKGLEESDIDGFIDNVLVNGKPWLSGMQEVLSGSHVFVCAHASRDKRCGVCGPALIEKFKEEINSRGLKNQVFVSACSHVGGHKYAGNLIIFSADTEGKIAGHWYGYATPDDVPAFLDQHIAKGEIIERLWRGQMGASDEEAENVGDKKVRNETLLEETKKPNGNSNNVKSEITASCCQGVNEVSCCRDTNLEVRETK